MQDLAKSLSSIISKTISPLLREQGFKRQGQNFFCDLGEIGQAFNVQKNKWNSKEACSFTFNLGLIHYQIHKEAGHIALPKFPKEYHCDIRLRIGRLKEYERDFWYEMHQGSSMTNISNLIHRDMVNYVLPFFKQHQDPTTWPSLIASRNNIWLPYKVKFLILDKYASSESAISFLQARYDEALVPTSGTKMEKVDGEWVNVETPPSVNQSWINHIEVFAQERKVKLRQRK